MERDAWKGLRGDFTPRSELLKILETYFFIDILLFFVWRVPRMEFQ